MAFLQIRTGSEDTVIVTSKRKRIDYGINFTALIPSRY